MKGRRERVRRIHGARQPPTSRVPVPAAEPPPTILLGPPLPVPLGIVSGHHSGAGPSVFGVARHIRPVLRAPPNLLIRARGRRALSVAGPSGDRTLPRGPGAVGAVGRDPQGPPAYAPEPADLQARDPTLPAPPPHGRPVHPEALGRLLRAQEHDVVAAVPSFVSPPEPSHGTPTVHPFAHPGHRRPSSAIHRGAWKGCSPHFACIGFSELRAEGVLRSGGVRVLPRGSGTRRVCGAVG